MASVNFERALSLIDAAHALDPTTITPPGSPEPIPYELHYAQQMTHYLSLRSPDASAVLRVAVRGQHFRRWEVPRTSYPMTKPGYLAWRGGLKKRMAEQVGEICRGCGFTAGEIGEVERLIRKEDLKSNEETQVLEDVACLVFLDDQFEEFEKGVEEEKMLGILRKTWGKMSPRGRELALEIPMSERSKEIVGKALAGP